MTLSVIHTTIGCVSCNQEIRDKIFDSSFLPNIGIMFSAFFIVALVVAFLSYLSAKRYQTLVDAYPNSKFLNPVPFSTASIVTGIGIGGFIDGILLHQLLQWHQILSNIKFRLIVM